MNAASLGLRVVMCDGGSSSEFLDKLEGFKYNGLTVVSSKTTGRGPQRRAAFEIAALLDGKVTIYTQAEKKYYPEI